MRPKPGILVPAKWPVQISKDVEVAARRPVLRAKWNALLLRFVKGLYKRVPGWDLSEDMRYSGKNPELQVKGLATSISILLDRGDTATALGVANELRILAASGRLRHSSSVHALRGVASVYERCGQIQDAVDVREQILELEREAHGAQAQETIQAMEPLGVDLRKAGAFSRAVEVQREVAAWWRTQEPERPAETAHAGTHLGISLIKLREFQEAREVLEHTVGLMGDSNPEARVACGWLAFVLVRQGDREAALRLREKVVSLSTRAYGPEDRRTLHDIDMLADVLRGLGQRDRARGLMEGSLASRERVLGDNDPDTQKARERLTAYLGEIE